MSNWFAIHRCPEAARLQRDHPNAFLLLLQVLQRARWQKSRCTKTGLGYGQAFVGDFENAGIATRKAYRNAMEVLERGQACRFEGAKLTANQRAELGANLRANRGTIATLLESKIFTVSVSPRGQAKGQASGPASDLTGATNVQGMNKDSTSPASKEMPEVAVVWNSHPELPQVLSFGPARLKLLKAMIELPQWEARWREGIANLAGSDFATGGGEKRWKATIDFFLTPRGFENSLSGMYANRRQQTTPRRGTSARDFSLNSASSAHDFQLP
jgi:hypothetical protein